MVIAKIPWDLELLSLSLVSAVVLRFAPLTKAAIVSEKLVTGCCVSPSTKTPFFGSSRRLKFDLPRF